MRDVLPTRDNLSRRGVEMERHCSTCLVERESAFHALVGCMEVGEAWQLGGMVDWISTETTLENWFEQAMFTKRKEYICKMAFLMYNIWHARNKLVWEGKKLRAMDVWRATERSINDWRNFERTSKAQPANPSTWSSRRRCCVDAALFLDGRRGGFRAVLLSVEGSFIAAMNGPIPNIDDPHQAEAIACREALSWIKELNLNDVCLE